MPNDPLTPHTVARRLGVSVSTVQRWLRDGTLRGQKLGPRMWTIPAKSLDGFTPPARGPRPAADRRRLGELAAEWTALNPDYLEFGAHEDDVIELARQAGVNRERARQALAKAIRQARYQQMQEAQGER